MEPNNNVANSPVSVAPQPVILLNPGLGDSFRTIIRIPVVAKRNATITNIMSEKIDSGSFPPSSNNAKTRIAAPTPPGAKVGIDRCCFISFGLSFSAPFSIYSSLFHIFLLDSDVGCVPGLNAPSHFLFYNSLCPIIADNTVEALIILQS